MKFQSAHLEWIRAALGDAPALTRFRSQFPDWYRLPYLWTRLLPALAQRHSLTAAEQAFFDGILPGLEREWRSVDRATDQALACLNEAGVPHLLLKGQALKDYYARRIERPMGDADALIRFEDLGRATQALQKQGWQLQQSPPQAAHVRHASSLLSPDGVSLDLHWYSLECCRWAGVDETFWRCAQDQRLLPTHLFLHTAVHGWRTGWSGLWVLDLDRLLQRENLDWHEMFAEARRRKILPLLSSCLGFLRQQFQFNLPRPPAAPWDLFCWCKTHLENPLSRLLVPWLEYRRTGGRTLRGWLTFLRQRWDLPPGTRLLSEAGRRWTRRAAAPSLPAQAPAFPLQTVSQFWNRLDYHEAQAIIHPFHNEAHWAQSVVAQIFTAGVESPAPRRALEIGCGMGRVLLPVSERVEAVTGVDLSPLMVEHSRTFLGDRPNIQVLLGDGQNLPVPDQSQDLVYSVICFQHIPDRRIIQNYLVEARRVLVSGGRVRAQTLHLQARPEVQPHYNGCGYCYSSLAEFAQDFVRAGLRVIESEQQGDYLWVTGLKP